MFNIFAIVMLPYLTFTTAKVKIKLLSHFFPNSHGCTQDCNKEAFLPAKGFHANLVHFLLPHHVIIHKLHVCSFTGTISHMHGRALNRFCVHEISCTKNYNLWRPDSAFLCCKEVGTHNSRLNNSLRMSFGWLMDTHKMTLFLNKMLRTWKKQIEQDSISWSVHYCIYITFFLLKWLKDFFFQPTILKNAM